MSRWPRLSESLPGAPSLECCMLCGGEADLSRWQEHDDQDRPEPIVVVLCDRCEKIVPPHPRLYRQLHYNEPFPGAMDLCDGCSHRDGLRCRHPDLKANGGPGLAITAPRPQSVHVCGSRGCRTEKWWPGPPTACAGRQRPVLVRDDVLEEEEGDDAA